MASRGPLKASRHPVTTRTAAPPGAARPSRRSGPSLRADAAAAMAGGGDGGGWRWHNGVRVVFDACGRECSICLCSSVEILREISDGSVAQVYVAISDGSVAQVYVAISDGSVAQMYMLQSVMARLPRCICCNQ
jgi:hypothetical protein